jgi:hypothetical protein
VSIPVLVERRAPEPGRSRYRLRLPAPLLPAVAVVLDVAAGHVLRDARVLESQLAGGHAVPVELGRATLRRVEKDGAAAEALRVTIARPREAELDLVVEDGNNPPLQFDGASVELAELPWIYFDAPAGNVVARYGDRRAKAPTYDLEAARESIRIDTVPEARWGEPRETVEGRPAPDAVMPDVGAPIEADRFEHRRRIPDGTPGLAALLLDADVLARSRGPAAGFADVRIADDDARQIPYLLERRDEPLAVDVSLRAAKLSGEDAAAAGRSVHALSLPYPDLPEVRLVLETSDRVFQRTVQAGVERPPDRRRRDTWFDPLASAVWQHADPGTPAPPLVLRLGTREESGLLVVVDEGDNRPLAITGARLLLPAWRLRFYRPDRRLHLLYGREDLDPPRYDLALLAPQVMGGPASDLTLDPEDAGTAGEVQGGLPAGLFWAGLGLAVVILLGVILRLVRA